jgi:hypothetical protein
VLRETGDELFLADFAGLIGPSKLTESMTIVFRWEKPPATFVSCFMISTFLGESRVSEATFNSLGYLAVGGGRGQQRLNHDYKKQRSRCQRISSARATGAHAVPKARSQMQ